MQKEMEVLLFLRNNGGSSHRSQVALEVFQNHISSVELDQLLSTVLSGFVTARTRKNKQTWKLTQAGWSASANHIATTAQNAPPTQEEPASDGYARFKALARENPDASPQRLLQLASRHLGDPLEDTEHWRTFRAQNPEWFLAQPKDWYPHDVELDADGYPMRYPAEPLTAKEREVRPTNDRGWFDRAMRQPGASLEPLAVPMPAFEMANILRVVKKVGEQAAVEIFGTGKIATARQLAGISSAS